MIDRNPSFASLGQSITQPRERRRGRKMATCPPPARRTQGIWHKDQRPKSLFEETFGSGDMTSSITDGLTEDVHSCRGHGARSTDINVR